MKHMILAATLVAVLGGVAHAKTPTVTGTTPSTKAAPAALSAKQRSALVRELQQRWGGSETGLDTAKLGRLAKEASDASLQAAVEMPSANAAVGALLGQPLDSARMVDAMTSVTPKMLGSTIADTVYTPLPNGRCRIADSRVINAMTGAGQTTVELDVENVADYMLQGGKGVAGGATSAACGMPTGATAYLVNFRLLPAGPRGLFFLHETGKLPSEGGSTVFSGTVGESGQMIVRNCTTCNNELSITTTAASDYAIDIVGYYMPPEATPLDCVQTNVTQNVDANFPFDIQIPACPVGYTVTGAGCRTPGFNDANFAINGLFLQFGGGIGQYCSGLNITAGQITVEGAAQCCRTPGR